MRLRLPALLCALLAATGVAADPATTRIPERAVAVADTLRAQALDGSGAFDIVEALTTEVGPRMPGTAADARAVEWAKARFTALGFDRVYTEPVTFPMWHRGHERAEVLAPFPQPLALTALGGSIGTGGALDAEVVEFPSLQALIDAPADTVRGRIAYITFRMERFRDGHGYGAAVGARSSGAIEAAKKGAVALLIRSIGTDSDRFPHTGMMKYDPALPRIPAAALSNPDADLLSAMLRRGQPVTVRLDIDAETRADYTSQNVIGEIRGREAPDEVVVIGAHLDSWDLGTGAIDDGAGIAITMAAGALIGRQPVAPRRTVRVIAWANEEQGLIGAKAYAAAHAGAVRQHIIAAESDFGAGRIYGFNSNAPAHARDALLTIAKALQPLGIEYLPARGGPGPDVLPLASQGVTWAWLGQDGTDYFDYHHTANDTLDKIDPAALDQQVAAYAVFAWLVAEAEGDFGSAPKATQ